MLGWFAETTLVAAGLAALAVFAGRSTRITPEARHGLWVVVLLKFLIPPVVAWPLGNYSTIRRPNVETRAEPRPGISTIAPALEIASIPRPSSTFKPFEPPMDLAEPEVPELPDDPFLAEPIATVALDGGRQVREPAIRQADPAPLQPSASGWGGTIVAPRLDWSMLLVICWGVGTVVVAARGLARIARFRGTLTRASTAPGWLVEELASVGDRLGVKPPPVLVATGLPTPLLWCLGAPRLVVPESLGRMTPDARAGLLAHELAHLARWDHWVVRLELLAGLIWWWNPVFRFARRRLRDEAEAACDARVVRAFPHHRFAYAEALVQVCEHHARPVPPLPALGIGGAWAARTLEARLTMILRDPIRPPSRRATLGALTLLALSLPSWTLGRQEPVKPAETPKVEAPQTVDPAKPTPTADPKPDPKPSVAVASNSPWTMDQIREGFQGRRWPNQGLTFRCSFAARLVDRMGAKRVSIQVADVALGNRSVSGVLATATNPPLDDRLGQSSRIDALTAQVDRRNSFRRFVAETPRDLVTFDSYSDQSSPVSLRWLPARVGGKFQGDDLALALGNQPATEEDRSLNPIDPRPANLLDLQGATPLLFDQNAARMELAGVEVVDGVEAVRVAWITWIIQPGMSTQVHGLCWVAPELGFAVVRFEASANLPTGGTQIRRSWRKVFSGFEKVGDIWLPRKVTYQTTNGPGNPNLMPATTDLVATFEDYRANPPLSAETFKPKFNIAGLNPESGNFTATPPEVPPGLVDLLNRAETASPFGPPRVETLTQSQPAEKLDQPPTPYYSQTKLSVPRSARAPGGDANTSKVTPPPTPQEKPPGQDSPPAKPENALSVEEPSQPGPDSELVAQKEVARLVDQLLRIQKVARTSGDPAALKIEAKLAESRSQLDQFPKKTTPPSTLFQTRRDAQAAELRRFEAERDRAKAFVDRNDALLKQNANYVSREEIALAQANLRIAEAAIDRERAKLAEADLLLNQANAAPASDRKTTSNRGQAALLQARRDAQAAEVAKYQARFNLASDESVSANMRFQNNQFSQENLNQVSFQFRIAELELAREKAKLAEADAMLDQAIPDSSIGADPSPPDTRPSPTLSDYRDLADLAEVHLQGKLAELRGAEARVNQARMRVNARSIPPNEARITQGQMLEFEEIYETARGDLKTKEFEVQEAALRLKQAKRRADFEEGRLKRLAERTKVELDRARDLFQKKITGPFPVYQVQGRYDDLMFQLDPNYKPEPSPPENPLQPSHPANPPH